MLKKLLIGIGIIIIIPLFIALMLDNEYEVEKNIIIDQPITQVFSYIKLLKNQDNYSTWAKLDPNTQRSYKGTDGTVGFISKWNSQNPEVGTGEQEIVAILPSKRIDLQLRFLKPFKATEPAYMTTQAMGTNQTKVTWGFKGHLNYPMNLMFLAIDFEHQIGNELQQGLNNLKVILEKKDNTTKYID